MAVPADAEKTLLEVAVGRQRSRADHAVDASVDHDRDRVGHLGRDANVLLDHQDRHVALFGEAAQRLLDMGDDDRGEPLRRFVHHQEARVLQQGAADRQHLLLAAGQLAAAVATALGEPREDLVDAFARPGSALAVCIMRRCSSTVSDRQSRRPCGT